MKYQEKWQNWDTESIKMSEEERGNPGDIAALWLCSIVYGDYIAGGGGEALETVCQRAWLGSVSPASLNTLMLWQLWATMRVLESEAWGLCMK